MDFVFLDTETTGLHPSIDAILEIAIVGYDGTTMLDTLVSPGCRRSNWPSAQAIHGIAPEMVKNSPPLEELKEKIQQIVEGRDVVIYNADFDVGFLTGGFLQTASSIDCAMLRYAEYYGEWSEYHEGYKWQKLISAARATGYKWDGPAHRALADAKACRHVWLWLCENENSQIEH